MPNLQSALREEIQRLARKEVRAEVGAMKQTVTQQRKDIAELKRRNKSLESAVAFLQGREKKRLKAGPAKDAPPEGSRFSMRSLKAQRRRAGVSQEEYARLVGVSRLSIYNWESGRTKPGPKHLAALVALRGLGKREVAKRLELMGE